MKNFAKILMIADFPISVSPSCPDDPETGTQTMVFHTGS
jgi:hypothetical protein